MKPRRVMVILEVETDVPIKEIPKRWGKCGYLSLHLAGKSSPVKIVQVQVNVIKQPKSPKKSKG